MQNLKSLLLNSRILLVLVLLALFAGCSDDEGSSTQPGTLDRLFSYPVIQGCSICHYGGTSGPDLSKANFTSNLVGKKSGAYDWTKYTELTATCGIDTVYVDAGRIAIKSSVLNSISQTYDKSSCISAIGIHEPESAVLSNAALTDFVLWIENGTPAN